MSAGSGERLKHIVRAIVVLSALALLAFLIYMNIAPFGATVVYEIDMGEESEYMEMPSPLLPSSAMGINDDGSLYQIPQFKMTTDQVSFDLKVPYEDIEEAEIKLEYREDPGELLLGVKNPSAGEYMYKPINNRILNNLDWDRIEGEGLSLYQKEKRFKTVEAFLLDPPMPIEDERTGVSKIQIAAYYFEPKYIPQEIDKSTINDGSQINNSLRGPHTFYIVVKDQPLDISLTKQELNMSKGLDPLRINIYSNTDLIYSELVDDDGDISDDRNASSPQHNNISLDLEDGIYKIDLLCGLDVVIKNIASSQRYITFADEIFLADTDIYSIGPTKSVTVYSYGDELGAETWHPEGLQDLQINEDLLLDINEVDEEYSIEMPQGINKIEVPEGDVILRSTGGSFAFSEESLFDLSKKITVPLTFDLNLEDIEYVISDYTPPVVENEWRSKTIKLDLSQIEPEDNLLNFVLFSPDLYKWKGEILLGPMEITLTKL